MTLKTANINPNNIYKYQPITIMFTYISFTIRNKKKW